MENWQVPEHMQSLKGLSVKNFGYDTRSLIDYRFNAHGFRGDEFDLTGKKLITIGNSISFGIGLDESQMFSTQLSSKLNLKLHNLSLGCYFHENHDHLANLKILSEIDSDDIFIIQLNNLDRRRITSNTVVDNNSKNFCISKLIDYFEQTLELLKHKTKIFLYWDTIEYDIPKTISDHFLIHNQFHLDRSIDANPTTFGIKSHNAVFKTIYSRLSSHKVADKLIS